jgi:glucosamine--fructose-6-phosphate aminotransferase (isomerizing)
MLNINRCKSCLLPKNYPFIVFNVQNICNYCNDYKSTPRFEHELINKFNFEKSKKKKYDCLVGLSGGRDSVYGLYLLKEKFGLNPLAYTYDWGFLSDVARMNISKICGILGVEHILRADSIENMRYLTSLNVKALLKDIKLGMVPIVQSLDKRFLQFSKKIAKENSIDMVIHFTGYECEQRDFFMGFAGINQKIKNNQHMNSYKFYNKIKLGFYYFKNFLLNKSYFNKSFFLNLEAFYISFFQKNNIIHFYNYVEWNEIKIEKKLSELGYIRSLDYGGNQWRMGDTQTAFNNYIYKELCGFTEFDEFRSHQIRMGHISRDEGLKLLEEDNKPKKGAIDKFCKTINLDPDVFYKCVKKAKFLNNFI